VGCSAIRIGSGDSSSSANNGYENSIIRNNLIEDAAWFIRQSVALYVCIARDVKILHNSIHDCSYSGISIGWRWQSVTWAYDAPNYNLKRVEIAYNLIEGMMVAAYAIGASEGIVYVRAEYPLAIEHLTLAIEQARKANLLDVNRTALKLGADFE
jgi:hypothetical protein